MSLIPWRHKGEQTEDGTGTAITRLRNEMDQLFDQFFRDPWGAMFRGGWGHALPVDVSETDKEVCVTAELPGIDPKDVDINVSGNILSISGEKKEEREEKERNYQFMERSFGRFQRSIELPSSVDPDKVEATYKNGTLTVTLAKKPEAQRKRIEVKRG